MCNKVYARQRQNINLLVKQAYAVIYKKALQQV